MDILTQLAEKFPNNAFVKIISTDCIPNYPNANLPTLLIYHESKCVKTIAGLTVFGGKRASPERAFQLFSKCNQIFLRHFDPINISFDSKNNWFSGWPKCVQTKQVRPFSEANEHCLNVRSSHSATIQPIYRLCHPKHCLFLLQQMRDYRMTAFQQDIVVSISSPSTERINNVKRTVWAVTSPFDLLQMRFEKTAHRFTSRVEPPWPHEPASSKKTYSNRLRNTPDRFFAMQFPKISKRCAIQSYDNVSFFFFSQVFYGDRHLTPWNSPKLADVVLPRSRQKIVIFSLSKHFFRVKISQKNS